MKTLLAAICLALMAAVASAQELRIDATNEQTLGASVATIKLTLTPDQWTEFAKSLSVALMRDRWLNKNPAEQDDTTIEVMRRLFDGKTVAEVTAMGR